MNMSRVFKNITALSINTAFAPLLFAVTLVSVAAMTGYALPMDEITAEIFGLATSCIWTVASVNYVSTALRRVDTSLVASFVVGLYRLPSFLASVAILSIMTTVGMFCLVAPGFYVLCRWGLAPILVASEDLSVSEAFTRCEQLTEGYRWQLFALLVTWVVVTFGLQFAAIQLTIACLTSFHPVLLFAMLPLFGLALQWVTLVSATVVCDELAS